MRWWISLCFVLASASISAKTELGISTLYPPGSDPVRSLMALSDQMERATQGNVSLKIYPGGVMGNDTTVLRKLRIGQLQGALVSSSTVDLISQELKQLSQPFRFSDLDEVYALRQTTDLEMRDTLREEDWHSYGPLDGGFTYLMSSQQQRTLSDVRSSKLWLPNTSDIQALARELDVSYLVMNIGDVATALDTGAVNTLIAPSSAALTLNWFSRFSYMSDAPVIYTWGMLIIPDREMRRIPADYQAIVDELLREWSVQLDQQMRLSNQQADIALRQLLTVIPFDEQELISLRTGVSENYP